MAGNVRALAKLGPMPVARHRAPLSAGSAKSSKAVPAPPIAGLPHLAAQAAARKLARRPHRHKPTSPTPNLNRCGRARASTPPSKRSGEGRTRAGPKGRAWNGWGSKTDPNGASFDVGTITPDRCALFCYPDSVPDSFSDDRIGTALLFNTALDAPTRQQIVAWLMTRWGI
jgi:hypothetical protein